MPATTSTQDSAEPPNDPAKRRRRWTQEEKWEIVRESFDPTKSLHVVAARYNVNPSQLSRWRRQYRNQILSTTKSDEEGPANTGKTE
ncbi:transposase [Burkholderia ubonensis]|uniref:transposase n=1 Tax=Burkholderia ubonensis TaxID=101571 RepID=UPI000A733955|nr:transposase [Burkholderia ubonensis]